jgi:hypothetical protein
MDIYGTTQEYDGRSYRTISRIVIEDDGYTYLSPEYNEALETRTAAAMAECQDDCGDCTTADPVVVSGSTAITAPGSYQYSASGGVGTLVFSASGNGVSIDADGLLTVAEDACGMFTVYASDDCGSGSLEGGITNTGGWEIVSNCLHWGYWTGDTYSTVVQPYRYTDDFCTGYRCDGLPPPDDYCKGGCSCSGMISAPSHSCGCPEGSRKEQRSCT